ncbi:MAG: choice-of-anchor J domain-containing protein [Bacteroidales bacterium]|nr:choice-of-anchor J domain-containing protein [Bacteroidales bacterium]
MSTPYNCGFESSDDFNSCWIKTFEAAGTWTSAPSASNYMPAIMTNYHRTGSSSVNIYGYYSSNDIITRSTKSWIATPAINTTDISGKSISFSLYKTTQQARVHVGVMSDPSDASTLEEVMELTPSATNTWENYSLPLSSVTGITSQHIAFLIDGEESLIPAGMYIDDFMVFDTPACPDASMISAENVGGTSADLTWLGIAPQWQIKITTTAANNPDSIVSAFIDTLVNTVPVSLTGLSPQTDYYVYVRPVCTSTGNGTGNWSSYAFRTGCLDITVLPYIEEFLNDGSDFPECWTRVQSYQNIYPLYLTNSNHTPNSPNSTALMFYCDGALRNFVATQRIDIPGKRIQDLRLTFYARTTYSASGIAVGVMDNLTDPSTFTPVDTILITGQTDWTEFIVDFTNYAGTGKYIAFSDNHTTSTNIIYLDDVRLEVIPTCDRPRTINITGITENSISCTWVTGASSETQWQVAIGTPGFNPDSNALSRAIVNTTASHTFTGLSASTPYYVYVRAICQPGDTSLWSEPQATRTANAIESLPFSTDFSNTADNAKWAPIGTAVNSWYCGTATGYGDSTAMYISNDGGLTNAYNESSTSYAYAYRTFRFTPGRYAITYNWKGVGDNNKYDFMRAFLVPDNVTLTPGDNGIGYMTSPSSAWIPIDGGEGLCGETNWQSMDLSLNITDTTVYNVVFYWYNNSYSIGNPPAAIDNLYIGMETCYRPDLNPQLLDTCITFNPSSTDNTVQAFEIYMNPTAFTPNDLSSAAWHATVTPGNSFTVNGLTANTTYYVLARSICSAGDTSAWSSNMVKTACEVIYNLPYSWDFESNYTTEGTGYYAYSIPNCWSYPYKNTYPYIASGGGTGNVSGHNGSSNFLYFYGYISSYSSTYSMITTPYIYVPDITRYRVELYMQSDNVGQKLLVGITNDPTDVNAFIPIDTLTTTSAGIWEYKVAHLHDYTGNTIGKNYIVLYGDPSGCDFLVDDITIREDRLCTQPDNLSITNLTATGAQLNWNANNGMSFDVLITTSPVDPDTITGTESEVFMFEQQLTDNNIDLTGYLTTNTTYYCYVQADCQAADSMRSVWSDEYHFTTICNAQNLPFSESFDMNTVSVTSSLPSCWNGLYAVTGSVPTNINYAPICQGTNYYNNNNSTALQLYAYYNTGGSTKSAIVLPSFSTNFTPYKMTFMNKASINGVKMLVGVMTDPGDLSSFTTLDTVLCYDNWTSYATRLNGYTGSTTGAYLAILIDGDINGTTCSAYIDDLTIESCTSCAEPSNLRVINVAGNEADVMLNTLHANDTMVNIQVTNFQVTNLTDLDSLNSTAFVIDTTININQLPLHLSNLDGLTNYFVYARVACGSGTYSPRSEIVASFRTGCAPLAIPYSCDFSDSYYDEANSSSWTSVYKPSCWNTVMMDGSHSYPRINSSYSRSSANSLYFYSTSGNLNYAVMPELKVDSLQGLSLTFYGYKSSSNGAITLGTVSDFDSIASFDSITTFVPAVTSTWEKFGYDFSNYIGTNKYIAFRVGAASGYISFYIDDLYLEETPTCWRPDPAQTTGCTENSVAVSWTGLNATDSLWDVVIVPQGSSPENIGTPVRTNATSHIFHNLTAGTNYDVYVRTVCSATDFSSWSDACKARTANTPENVPVVTDFSNSADNSHWALINGTETNQWVIGSATGNGDNTSLYITNDGSSYNYNISATSAVYAYRTIRFVPGDYTIAFDWKCTGESGYDVGRAFLVSPSATPEAGTMYSISFTPTGWINLTPNKTFASNTNWTHESYALTVTDTTVYNLVFTWQNDYSYGSQPPVAIDNVSVTERVCYMEDVVASGLSGTDIALISYQSDATSFETVISTTALTAEELDTISTVAVTSLPFVFTGLTPETNYNVYVRGFCATGDTTSWNFGTATTLCADILVNDTVSYTENFDSYATYSQPSCWFAESNYYYGGYPYIESTTAYSTSNSFYFYSTNSYYSYAAMPAVTGTPINQVNVSLKLYSSSTSNYIDVGVTDNPSDYGSFVLIKRVPVAVANAWNDVSVNLTAYQGVGRCVAFRTPGVQSNSVYIDNVVLAVVDSCTYPGLTTTVNDYNDIVLNIIPAHATDSIWEVAITSTNTQPTGSDDFNAVVTSPNTTANITTLSANTTYYIWTRTWCNGDSTSASVWHNSLFRTPCSSVLVDSVNSFYADFDSDVAGTGVIPSCWTGNSTYYSNYPCLSTTYSQSPSNSFMISCYDDNNTGLYTYAATPQLAGTPVSQMELEFYYRCSSGSFVVGVMTDPEDISTFTAVKTITPTVTNNWTSDVVSFAVYTGTGRYVAFKATGTVSFYIDNVDIHKTAACARPTVNIDSTASDSICLTITPANANDSLWEVIVTTATTPDTTTAAWYGTTTSTNLCISGLSPATGYTVYARTLCGGGETSQWANDKANTACGDVTISLTQSYRQSFDNYQGGTAYPKPNCWTTYSSYGSDYPYISTSRNSSAPGSLYFYGSTSSIYSYAATPRIVGVDANLLEVKYKVYFNSTSYVAMMGVMTNPNDISTFTVIDSVNASILNAGEWIQRTVNLENYTDTGRYIAWYASDNLGNSTYFYIDDVEISARHYSGTKGINATVCDGYNYVGNGFNIPSTRIDITQSPMTFTRIVNDTLVTLTLNINPSVVTVINDTINAGETYTLNGFNVSTAGTYQQYLNTSLGCDSTVTLNLFVDSTTVVVPDTLIDNVAVCDNELPYTWHGNSYTAAGTYNVTENGDLYVLNLTVNPTYNTTETQTITSADLPYTWNGQTITAAGTYTYRGTTAAGCDSVVTLILTVNVGIDYAEDGMFAISPNPVKRGGEVRLDVTLNEADRDGLVIELFTSNGELIDRTEPKEQPMFVKMPDVDGLYMIRLTTGTGRVMYGKVIVK